MAGTITVAEVQLGLIEEDGKLFLQSAALVGPFPLPAFKIQVFSLDQAMQLIMGAHKAVSEHAAVQAAHDPAAKKA